MEYKGKFRIVQVHCPVCHIDTRASYRHSYKKNSVILMKAKIELNIAWINLNGINSSQKGRTFSNFLDEFGKSTYDGIMVQEPRYKLEKQEKQDFNWESLCKAKNLTAYFTANERGAGGVGVIWKNKSVDEKLSDLQITEPAPGEAILTCFVMAGEAFAVCNLYASAANKENKRGDLFRTLQETLPEAVIVGGDFNLVLDTVQDLQRPVTTKSEYQNGGWDELMIMSRALGIKDGWREQVGPHEVLFTHTVHNNARLPPNDDEGSEQAEENRNKKNKDKGLVTCQSRIDFVLAPDPEVISPVCNMEFGHDLIFWAGEGQADHVATTLKLTQGEEDEDAKQEKREMINPKIYVMPEWEQRRDMVWNQTLADVALQDRPCPIIMWEALQRAVTSEALLMTKELSKRFKDERAPLRRHMEWHMQHQAANPADHHIGRAI